MAHHPMSVRSDLGCKYYLCPFSGFWGAILSAFTEMDISHIWIRWHLTLCLREVREIWRRMQILRMSIFLVLVLGSAERDSQQSMKWTYVKFESDGNSHYPMSSDVGCKYYVCPFSWFCAAILSAFTEMDIRNIWIRWHITLCLIDLTSDANITYVHFIGSAEVFSQQSLKWA